MALVAPRRPAREQRWRSFQIVRRRADVWHSSCRKALGKTSFSSPLSFSLGRGRRSGSSLIERCFMRIFSRVVLAALLALILSLSPIFVSPSSAVEPTTAGDILVADPGSGTIRHYSASGAFIDEFASGLNSPSWITADRIGNIYVSEHDGQRISVFSPTGANLLTITTPYKPGGVQVGPDGTIYVADYFGGKIYRYSASGTDLGLFASTPLVQTDFMAFDAGGNLYVTGVTVTGFLLEDVVRLVSPIGEDLGSFVTGFSGPEGIAFDAE